MSKVILSNQTLQVLKNYSTINSSILIREGNVLKTISVGENAIAQYTCVETFPRTFGIYDLNQFLSGLSLFENPTLEFDNDNYVTIRGRGRSAKYYFSDPEITLKSAPEKNVRFPGADIEFNLTQEDLLGIQKAAAVYNLPDLVFCSSSEGIFLNLRDKENDTSNDYSQQVVGDSTGEYELTIKIENIRLLPGDYSVKVSKALISEWKHNNLDLTYYIALEP
ncbi:sliding clamp DNA polymerase accessory protein [Synechococcus phage S-PM2]|uniref:Sliding clamp n=1 Tax=Synechococcus phage S-PM2 TaxID=238854 RepID=Q5GQL6_BPSYP|nr:DNA polymerase processivity factor [Synechococcus phage S-PM2]CAF34186.1 sliding clamp DNA polymerase accessory protein [Synechococcus phage S-PM2]CFW42297.1 sliding clamp DNA polymerase accessory protein [Synechococcus phage S-PM2]